MDKGNQKKETQASGVAAKKINPRVRWTLLLSLLILYIAVRAITFAHSDNGIDFHHNAYDRGIFVQNWLRDFRLVPDAAYGPADYYAVAAVMRFVPDPVLSGRVLSFLCSLILFFVIYGLVRRLFGEWEAMGALLLAALHPHGIRLSVVGLEMMPYALALMAGFYAFHRFLADGAQAQWAIASGLLFTLAAATRFEAWIVLPVVAVFALLRDRKTGVVFTLAAGAFPIAWIAYNLSLYRDPFHFVKIAGNIAGVHMSGLPVWKRLLGWPAILVRYAPLPTALLTLASIPAAWRERYARPLLISWALTFLVFETQTARAAMGTNETKYVMPLVLLMIPQASREFVRRMRGGRFLRFVVLGMMTVLVILSYHSTTSDNDRFAAPKGAREQAEFLANLPRAKPDKIVIGTALQGYLLIEGRAQDRAILPYPEDATGRMSASRLAGFLSDPDAGYLAYEYEEPIDFDPVMHLPLDQPAPSWGGVNLERVFLSSDKKFAVYRIGRSGNS